MSTAYDYSAGVIAAAALRAAGVTTVMRYVSTPGNSKNISKSEYADLTAAGIAVGLVYETTADWALGGRAAGIAAAKAAREQASAVGYPAWHRIWYAMDFDAAASQLATILAALDGAAAAEGNAAYVAAYGDYDVCTAAAAAGYRAPWQTDAWSSGRWCSAAVLQQTGTQTVCGGVQVDENKLIGQLFLLPAPTPVPQLEEDEMAQSVDGQVDLSWSQGSKHVVQVSYDTAGANAGHRPTLRVVLELTTGPLVLADAWEPSPAAKVIEFPQHAANAYGICLQPVGTPARYAASVA